MNATRMLDKGAALPGQWAYDAGPCKLVAPVHEWPGVEQLAISLMYAVTCRQQ